MKIFASFLLVVINLSSIAFAQSTDARIQELQVGQFPAVYTDSTTQLSWSKKISSTYTNGCTDAEGRYDWDACTFEKAFSEYDRQVGVDDSDAAIACKKIGGRLPTKSEFESLIRNFDHTQGRYGPYLTDKGRAAMQTVFGDMDNNWFWTSSVYYYNTYVAYAFYRNGVAFAEHRGLSVMGVLCVVGR